MSSVSLECQYCRHRFQIDDIDNLPEEIFCPKCEKDHPHESYFALIFCQSCHAKLSVPLNIIHDANNACPQCGEVIDPHAYFDAEDSGMTIATNVATDTAEKRQLQDGEIFNKYRIITLLGKGGMAEVYLAEHILLKKQFALKLMRSNMADDDPVFIKRFLQEAKLLNSVIHRNIVKVFDVGNDFNRGVLFIVMEYVDGKNLLQVLRKHQFKETDLWNIMAAVTGALKTLHAANIVHRDIKPSNIMLSSSGELKLMDLGIAKFAGKRSEGEVTLTMERTTIGTPNYASPEQCCDAHDVDIRSDIYCLGVSLYHLATGILPFDGDTPIATILNVIHNELEPLDKLRPDLSPEFVALLNQMIAKKADDRPESPEVLLDTIRTIRKNLELQQNENKWQRAMRSLRKFFRRNSTPLLSANKKNRQTAAYSHFLKNLTLPTNAGTSTPAPENESKPELQTPSSSLTPTATTANTEKNSVAVFVKRHKRSIIFLLVMLTLFLCFNYLYVAFYSWSGKKDVKFPGWLNIFSHFNAPAQKKQTDAAPNVSPQTFTSPALDTHPLPFFRNLSANIAKGNYPEIYTNSIADTLITSYDFSQPLNPFFPWKANVKNGLLQFNGEENNKSHISGDYDAHTISVYFRLTGEKTDETILKLMPVHIFMMCVNGKLFFDLGNYQIATDIELPRNQWINLTLSLNVSKTLFTIHSGNRLLGAYFFPRKSGISQVSFGSTRYFHGQVARLELYKSPMRIKQHSPATFVSTPFDNKPPASTVADNGFVGNSIFNVFNKKSYLYYSKFSVVFVLDMKNRESVDLLNLSRDSYNSLIQHIKGRIQILPLAPNMKKSNTLRYKKNILPILRRLPENYQCHAPSILFFDKKGYFLTGETFSDLTSIINIITRVDQQIDDGTLTPFIPPVPWQTAKNIAAKSMNTRKSRSDREHSKNITAKSTDTREFLWPEDVIISYDFAKPLNPLSALKSKVRDGVLHLNGEKIKARRGNRTLSTCDQLFTGEMSLYHVSNTVMLDFMLTGSSKNETILTCHSFYAESKTKNGYTTEYVNTKQDHDYNSPSSIVMQIDCINNELCLSLRGEKIKTGITLPRNQWINLAVIKAPKQIAIYNGKRLLGIYPVNNHGRFCYVSFGRKNFFHGKVARFLMGRTAEIVSDNISSSQKVIIPAAQRPPVIEADNGFIYNLLPARTSSTRPALAHDIPTLVVDLSDPQALWLLNKIARSNLRCRIITTTRNIHKINTIPAKQISRFINDISNESKFVYTEPVLLFGTNTTITKKISCPDYETFAEIVY